MQKQLTRIGSSLGIIIDKPILELLRINADTPLEITTDGVSLTLRPIHQAGDEATQAAYKRVARKHSRSLRKLAK